MNSGSSEIGRVVLGRYRIVRVLAYGGQGVVYLARGEGAAGFVRPVVIKRVSSGLAQDLDRREQLAREARIMAQLRHPCIVDVIDFGQDGDSYALVLDYVHGFDLGRWMRFVNEKRGRVPVDLAVHVVVQVLEALHYAHTLAGPDGEPLHIVHRDVSPGNILIDVEGHVKLTDFGIARMQADGSGTTDPGQIKGQLAYIAPEVLRGDAPSGSSDCYSCAVVLHELLLGENEFRGAQPTETATRILRHEPTDLVCARPDALKELSEVLARALSKEPGDRFSSAKELAAALRATFRSDPADRAERFSQAVARDFGDPSFSRMAGLPPLHVLEQAWRDPAGDASPASKGVGSIVARMRLPRRAQRVTVSIGMLLCGAAAAIYFSRPRHEGAAGRVVYVHSEAAPDVPAKQAVAPHAAPSQDGRAGIRLSAKPGGRPAASRTARQELALTRTFARRQEDVERCFARHGAQRARLSIRFSIDRQGRVASAAVLPQRFHETPVGRCLRAVAQTTRFGSQREPLTFRIPIVARAGD